jgi:hypothetical protein
MNLDQLGSWGVQSSLLALRTACVLAVLTVAGGGLILGWAPRFFRLRWMVFAPIAGLALLTVLSLPLSLLGLPVAAYARPLLLGLAAASAAIAGWGLWRASRRRQGQLLFAYLRRDGLWLALGFTLVILVSAKMVSNSGRGQVDAVWGSSDFGAYWSVPAYLQQHGASVSAYESQTDFRAGDISDHLRLHARLGCMSAIAVLGQVLAPDRLAALLNPLLVASLWLMIALAHVFARRERLWSATALLLTVGHPFLYFLLFYSYHSQAFSVLLVATGLLILEVGDPARAPATRPRGAIAAGILLAAAILHYPSAFLAPGLYLGGKFIQRLRRGRPTGVIVCGITLLAVAGYHLPRTYHELAWLGQAPALPGWNWHRLANVHELLGLRSLIHFDAPAPDDLAATLVTLAVSALVGLGWWLHQRRGALPGSAAALLGATALLAFSSYWKYRHGVPNATHGLAKALSQYALFAVVFATAGALAAMPARRRQAQRFALLGATAFALIQFFQVVNWRRAAWFDYDLITLVDRQRHSPLPLAFDPEWDDRLVAPVVRDERRLAPPDPSTPRLRFTRADSAGAIPGTVIDREGNYVAVRTP